MDEQKENLEGKMRLASREDTVKVHELAVCHCAKISLCYSVYRMETLLVTGQGELQDQDAESLRINSQTDRRAFSPIHLPI